MAVELRDAQIIKYLSPLRIFELSLIQQNHFIVYTVFMSHDISYLAFKSARRRSIDGNASVDKLRSSVCVKEIAGYWREKVRSFKILKM